MKMNNKFLLSLAISVFFSASGMFASSNERGIDLYRAELYGAAKLFLLGQKNQSTQDLAETQYYLGQAYSKLQQPDSAAYYYAQAIETDPAYPFGYIGEGMLALENKDAKAAETLFRKANGLAKKDPSVQTTIAEAYIAAQMDAEAEDALDKARKVNKKFPGIYLAEGDMLMKDGKVGDACARYENAIRFDASYKVAYLKLAQVYKEINTTEALKYLDQLTAIDPDYIPAYALIGDINRDAGFYLQALKAYEKFISIPGVPILQHERYAQLLYFTDQYDKSLQEIDYVLQQDPTNPIMHRLQAYNNFKLDNSTVALQQITQFLQDNPVDKHIYLDYITYGRLLLKANRTDEAISALQKAQALDPSKSEIYKELTSAYEAASNFPEAVNQYEKYFEIEKTPTVYDYLNYGRDNYMAASKYIDADYLATPLSPDQKQADDALFYNYVKKGNEAFAEVIERSPDSYHGYLWRARLNSFVDLRRQPTKSSPMEGVAKPYYEEALSVMLKNNEDGKRNNDIIEAYHYLASYYILRDDKVNSGEYFKKILNIDPNNAAAKNALDAMKIKY
ncbi:MAG: tetratricopeptide repeat protein [Candidatus Azobacteroides sp.]|nr:tetratricopeptide repeat protein [Candidatus Azobacteroides sp.]